MSTSSIAAFVVSLVLSATAAGCVPQRQAPPEAASASLAPPASASPSPPLVAASSARLSGDRHVYRFDFVLTTTEGNGSPSNTSFTLNLQDGERGEMVVGKNVALYTPPPAGPTAAAGPAFVASPRQDVGMKVLAVFRTQGDDVLLDVNVELSTFDQPSTIRKVVARGNALASPGKAAIVTTLDDDHKRYQLSVTPTKLR